MERGFLGSWNVLDLVWGGGYARGVYSSEFTTPHICVFSHMQIIYLHIYNSYAFCKNKQILVLVQKYKETYAIDSFY